MVQQRLDFLRRLVAGDEQGREGVAQIMEAHAPDTRFFEAAVEDSLAEVVRIQQPTHFVDEHPLREVSPPEL